mgnify:CR=1 FL=1|jgi:hypothetical protein
MDGYAQTPIYIELSDSSGDDDGPHATAAVSNKRQRVRTTPCQAATPTARLLTWILER